MQNYIFFTSVLSIAKHIQANLFYDIDQMYKSKTSTLQPNAIIQIWKMGKKKVSSETWLKAADKIKSHITKI